MENLEEGWLNASDLQLSQQQGYYSLSGDTFGGFSIEGADLSDGDFDHAAFEEITFIGCELTRASFDKTAFKKCIFIKCFLSGMSLLSAEFNEVSFLDCDIDGVAFDDATMIGVTMDGCTGQASFDNAEIKEAVISDCCIPNSTFLGTMLDNVDFSENNMTGCEFDNKSSFNDCVFNECDITQISLSEAEGLRDLKMHKCIYRPFLDKETEDKVPLALPPRGGTTSLGTDSRFSIYGNWGNTAANLTCSSMDEYRRVIHQ